LLGDRPSLADFGMMAPMFRHFSQDPEPEEIMRTEAPLVYEWVARMWRAEQRPSGTLISAADDCLTPLLREICETHLVQLAANAEAYASGATSFEMTVQGYAYTGMPVSRYRVYCLEELRRAFEALSPDQQTEVQERLPFPAAQVLWLDTPEARSDYNTDRHLPYGPAINVYGDGTP
jgi:hypothetical protein